MLKLPESITYDLQPYGKVTLADLRLGEYKGRPTVIGTVIAGVEHAYLWGAVRSKPATGERTIYGVRQSELDRGHIVRIAG